MNLLDSLIDNNNSNFAIAIKNLEIVKKICQS